MPTLLKSKLRPAAIPGFAVRRPRLARRIDKGVAHRLTLLSAPAGFGKSVLVAEWAARRDDVAWLTLDARDGNPARMARHLVEALAPRGLDFDRDDFALVPPGSESLGDVLIDRLVEKLHEVGETCLVIEDIDRAGDTPLTNDLGRLIHEAPRGLRFVVTCRADPSFPLHRLRARGELTELRADDLRLTVDEARVLLDTLGDGNVLTDDQIDHLVARSEGWPVAVQLAALSLRLVDDVDLFIDRYAGDDRNVADFLTNEILDHEDDDTRRFLLDVSVLEQLEPDLCDAITGRRDSAEMLVALERRGLFVTRASSTGESYRCYRLLREFLRHDLRASAPTRRRELLERAAQWHLATGDVAEAASCLVEGEAWPALEALVWSHGRAHAEAGDPANVIRWIEAIPLDARSADVKLRLTQAAVNSIIGRAATARSILHSLETEETLSPGEQVVVDMVVASIVEGTEPPASAIERTRRVLAARPTMPDAEVPDCFGLTASAPMQCFTLVTAARAHLLLGEAGVAFELARRAIMSPGTAMPGHQIHALGTLALLDALAGNLNAAEAGARRAFELAGRAPLRQPSTITSHAALAVVARARNELDPAHRVVGQARAHAERWRRWPWVGLMVAEQAHLETDRGRPERAIEVIRRFAQTSAPPPAPLVASRLHAAEARALFALDDTDLALRILDDDAVTIGGQVAVASARMLLATASRDASWARKELDNWPPDGEPLGRYERDLWSAVVDHLEGDLRAAIDAISALVARAEREGAVRTFLDAGPEALRAVRDVQRALQPRAHTRRILDAAAARPTPTTANELVEQLSARELTVLRYLPTRMAYGEIAREIYVSVNTLKTHVRHICQKLGVSGRDAAVARAQDLGLL